MQLEIRGHDFPGRSWAIDGEPCHNVHVGVQIRREPADLVPGDAATGNWLVDVEVVEREGNLDFRGPSVQGKRGERFVYLTWGNVGEDNTFAIFRRAKLMLDTIGDETVKSADLPGRRLVATVDLTDECGGPDADGCTRRNSRSLSNRAALVIGCLRLSRVARAWCRPGR